MGNPKEAFLKKKPVEVKITQTIVGNHLIRRLDYGNKIFKIQEEVFINGKWEELSERKYKEVSPGLFKLLEISFKTESRKEKFQRFFKQYAKIIKGK